jgi:hyperosmotically inducible protein
MLKRMSVVFCSAAVVLLTAGYATAQTATQDVKAAGSKTKAKTESAAKKTGTVLSDAEITSAVKTKLLADKTVGGLKIDVDTSKGVVTLTGPVNSAAEKAQALKLTKATHGVKSVVSKLTVEPKKH